MKLLKFLKGDIDLIYFPLWIIFYVLVIGLIITGILTYFGVLK